MVRGDPNSQKVTPIAVNATTGTVIPHEFSSASLPAPTGTAAMKPAATAWNPPRTHRKKRRPRQCGGSASRRWSTSAARRSLQLPDVYPWTLHLERDRVERDPARHRRLVDVRRMASSAGRRRRLSSILRYPLHQLLDSDSVRQRHQVSDKQAAHPHPARTPPDPGRGCWTFLIRTRNVRNYTT